MTQAKRPNLSRNLTRAILIGLGAALTLYAISSFRLGTRSVVFEPAVTKRAEAGERKASDLAKLRLLTRSVGYIRANYVSPARIKPMKMLMGALKSVEALVPEIMVTPDAREAEQARSVKVRVGDHERSFDISGVSDLYEMNWKLLDIFEFIAAHLPEDAREDEVEYAAINGLLSVLDEHSVFLPPRAYAEMKLDTEGRFGGLGIVITTRNGVITIVSVLPDTPAEKAGLKSMDQITDIGDETTTNMLLTDAVARLRGEPGTKVTIRVMRKGWVEPRTFTLERAEIHIRSVSSEALGNGVGYVRIRHFQEDTREELQKHLRQLKQKKSLDRLILDLRQNPGGLLQQSVQVADLFLKKGVIVVTEGEGNRIKEVYSANSDAPYAGVPIIVLVDGGTASAAEIVAAALSKNDRAILMGDTTFGKGTVQVLYEVGEGALKLTVAQYLTPDSHSIQGVGITPDIDLVPVRIGSKEISLGVREQRAERDEKRKLDPLAPVAEEVPSVRMPIFVEQEEEEDSDEPPIKDEEKFEKDEAIALAESLITSITSPSRSAGMRQAKERIKDLLAKREERLVQLLGQRGVDWTPGPVEPVPQVQLSWRLSQGNRLRAGKTEVIEVSAFNAGSQPIYRYHVFTVSSNPALDGREIIFGRLDPGQRLTRKLEVRVPEDAWDRLDKVDLIGYQNDQETGTATTVMVATASTPRPRFAFSVRVQDSQGDNDGLLDPGETADILVEVRNVGDGPAKEVLVTLRNKSGEALYVRKGRHHIKAGLNPGQSALARFTVEVRNRPGVDKVSMEIGILDTKKRDYVSEERSFRLGKGIDKGGEMAQAAFCVRRREAPLLASASDEAEVLYRLEEGTCLRAIGLIRGFYRVEIGPDEFGFVRASDGDLVNEIVKFTSLPDLPMQSITPAIVLKQDMTREDALRISGVARFFPHPSESSRRKILIFRGSDKVFFFASEGSKAEEEIPFDTTVTLEEGTNDIAVYAIDGKDLAATKRLTLYRPKGGTTALTLPFKGGGSP